MSNFDNEAIEALIKKMLEDETGKLAVAVNDLIKLCRKLGTLGVSLKEVAGAGTIGWYVYQDPNLEQFMDYLPSVGAPPTDDEFIN